MDGTTDRLRGVLGIYVREPRAGTTGNQAPGRVGTGGWVL